MALGSSAAGAGLGHAINWLRNGSLNRIFRGVSYTTYDDAPITDQPASDYAFQVTDDGGAGVYDPFPSLTLDVGGDAPTESLMANWSISGAQGQFVTEPRDPVSGERVTGFAGTSPVRFTFLETGEVVLEQSIDPFSHLLDRAATLFMFLGKDAGSVNAKLQIDYGTRVDESINVPSSAYGAGGNLRLNVTPPYDATQFVVKVTLSGNSNNSLYLGQMGLYLGNYSTVRFVDDITEQGRPRGECAFYWGYPAPPGYRTICEEDNLLVFHSTGDAQVDGFVEDPVGGEREHNHGGRTKVADSADNPKKDGKFVLAKNHYHFVAPAEMNPLNFKILIVERI